MSNTYRKTWYSISICNKCNKPFNKWFSKYVKEYAGTCECDGLKEHIKYNYIDTDRVFRKITVYRTEYTPERSVRDVFNYHVPDGQQGKSDSRKFYQRRRNKSYRRKCNMISRKIVKEWYQPEYEPPAYPTYKNEVDWDIW